MARRIFTCAAILVALAFAAGIAGIWIDDHRWGDTSDVLAIASAIVGFTGVFVGIWES